MKTTVTWEFKEVTQSGNLTIEEPAEIRFFYNYQADATKPAVINIAWKMDGYNNFTIGGIAQQNPFELILINNEDQTDKTTYNVRIPDGDRMTVAIKYLHKEC